MSHRRNGFRKQGPLELRGERDRGGERGRELHSTLGKEVVRKGTGLLYRDSLAGPSTPTVLVPTDWLEPQQGVFGKCSWS